ncbi:7-deoxyloganetin glucosyltransferase [Arachis hypogaea]|nr:7-deoxyloganetin glucosyltransferase [Arachis hypogaea]
MTIEIEILRVKDNKCLEWLDKRDRGSVVYVNFGSLVIMTPKQLSEFAWGLVNSKYHFLWVIRPNLVHDNNNNGDGKLSDEYVNVIERCERGLVLGWCQQEKVLCHASIGGFLTHCGWNSTLESICEGVLMACWPFFAEQQTNSFYACKKWGIGIGMEIECDVKREQVEGLVRELMEGQKGKEIKLTCHVSGRLPSHQPRRRKDERDQHGKQNTAEKRKANTSKYPGSVALCYATYIQSPPQLWKNFTIVNSITYTNNTGLTQSFHTQVLT